MFHGALTHDRQSVVIWECLGRQSAPLLYVDLCMSCVTCKMAEYSFKQTEDRVKLATFYKVELRASIPVCWVSATATGSCGPAFRKRSVWHLDYSIR